MVLACLAAVGGVAAATSCDSGSKQTSRSETAKRPVTIASSLEGMTVLPSRVPWTATPSLPPEAVQDVRFRIDRKLAWIDPDPPYEFGGEGAYLVTTWLESGVHRFTVRVRARDGSAGAATIRAEVRDVPLSRGPYGLFSRPVTAVARKAFGLRVDPSYPWSLDIYQGFVRIGWKDAESGNLLGHAYEDRATRRFLRIYAPIQMGPEGRGRDSAGFQVAGTDCGPGGPFATYEILPASGRARLFGGVFLADFRLIAKEESCSPRRAVLEGTWFGVD
jgi:hypothetical protein